MDDPDEAVPLPGATQLLHRLAARYGVAAVISGRPLAFLREHLGATPGLILVGLYGLERSAPDGSTIAAADATRWRPAIDQAADTAERELPSTVDVERKGLAMTLHVRRHPEEAAAAASWAARTAARAGLHVYAGRLSWELRPPVNADKGTIVEELANDLDAACFAGDDLGDLPAFAALDRLQATGVHTVKVGVRSDEAPPEIMDRASIVVDGPAGALAWLSQLLGERPG